MKESYARGYNLLAGLCDTATGVSLVTNPKLTLMLMGVAEYPIDDVFLRYVGCFVFAVGVSYFLPTLRSNTSEEFFTRSVSVWEYTTVVRLCVATFVSVMILLGELRLPWTSVVATDASLAGLQLYFLLKLERLKKGGQNG